MPEHEEAESQRDRDLVAGLARVHEVQKTVRTIAICLTIAVCVACISWAAIRLLDRPPWLVLLLALAAPSGVFVAAISVFRGYVRKTSRRVTELEQQLDRGRTTSGLNSDGTSKDGL